MHIPISRSDCQAKTSSRYCHHFKVTPDRPDRYFLYPGICARLAEACERNIVLYGAGPLRESGPLLIRSFHNSIMGSKGWIRVLPLFNEAVPRLNPCILTFQKSADKCRKKGGLPCLSPASSLIFKMELGANLAGEKRATISEA